MEGQTWMNKTALNQYVFLLCGWRLYNIFRLKSVYPGLKLKLLHTVSHEHSHCLSLSFMNIHARVHPL